MSLHLFNFFPRLFNSYCALAFFTLLVRVITYSLNSEVDRYLSLMSSVVESTMVSCFTESLISDVYLTQFMTLYCRAARLKAHRAKISARSVESGQTGSEGELNDSQINRRETALEAPDGFEDEEPTQYQTLSFFRISTTFCLRSWCIEPGQRGKSTTTSDFLELIEFFIAATKHNCNIMIYISAVNLPLAEAVYYTPLT